MSEQKQNYDGVADSISAVAVIGLIVGLVCFWLLGMPS